jgi:class 3 adenylate cyclase
MTRPCGCDRVQRGFTPFSDAADALDAAIDAQRALHHEVCETSSPLMVRIGVHTSEAQLRDGDYHRSAVNRPARLMAIAHCGQVVCSQATADLEGLAAITAILARVRDEHVSTRIPRVWV